jgi:hypothetical protein
MTFHYKATAEERIEVGFLIRSDANTVCKWLKDNFKEPEKGIYGESLDVYRDEGRRLIEYLLVRRNNRLIDHSLARYGYSIYCIQKAFDRGDASTRFAAISNIRSGLRLHKTLDILRSGKFREISQILQNKWLNGELIAAIINREGRFSDFTDEQFCLLISALRGNKRLIQEYSSLTLDGYDEYRYNRVFAAAWTLPSKVPANQEWGTLLWNFLSSVGRSGKPESLAEMIQRWKIDDQSKDVAGKWYMRSPSFNLRILLYDFLAADETLLKSDDAAARMSFYKRFSPYRFKEWDKFLEVDGEEFTNAVLENEALWRDSGQRDRLSRVCWATPDPNSTMDMPNNYRWKECRMREANPAWFINETGDGNNHIDIINERLDRIEQAIERLPQKRGIFG